MTDPGIFSIFDAAPSSLTLLREKPLGINHREPTLRELMAPLPPDRTIFKLGAMFNRFVHADSRKRHFDEHPHSQQKQNSSSARSSASPQRQTQSQQQQQQSQPPHSGHTPALSAAATMTPQTSGDKQQPPQPGNTALHVTFGDQDSGAGGSGAITPNNTNNNNAADSLATSQIGGNPAAATTSPGSRSPVTNNSVMGGGVAAVNPNEAKQKSLALLSRGLKANQSMRNRGTANANGDGSSLSGRNPLLDARQVHVPSAKLPYKGHLPPEASIVLAEIHSYAVQSARETQEFIRHGKEVVAKDSARSPSPLRQLDELIKKTSPKRMRHASRSAERRAQREKIAAQLAKSRGAAGNSVVAKGVATTTTYSSSSSDCDNDDADEDEEDERNATTGAGGGMGNAAKNLARQRKDPDLLPGIVSARSQMPPWKQVDPNDIANVGIAFSAGFRGKKSRKIVAPRFAAQTTAGARRRSSAVKFVQQQQQSSGRQQKQQPQKGGSAVDDNNEDSLEEQSELMRREMNFPKELRVEDKVELERRKKALEDQKRRHLDEMILARLAPAEREQRLASRAQLEPYRKMSDRKLPYPETAARDRYAQSKHVVPLLVQMGREHIDQVTAKWRPQSSMSARSRDSAGGGANSPLLIQSLGISASGGLTTGAPRVGRGGDLPAEGTPRMKNPNSPRELNEKLAQAQVRVVNQDVQLAAKMTNLETKLAAKHQRAEARKTMYG